MTNKNKTYEYLSRNDDGGKKPIGITGLIFGAIVMFTFMIVAIQELWSYYS